MDFKSLFRTKNIASILQEAKLKDAASTEGELKRNLTVRDLAMLGIAAIVGAGIFSTIGQACFDGGPAVSLLFIGIAIACGFSALCYAEFASRIPISGSAYTYAYATFGEIIAWIIGWDLILEYAIGNITVSIAWSGNFVKFLSDCGVHLPQYLTTSFLEAQKYMPELYASAPKLFGIPFIINIPAFCINALITWLVYIGIKESKNFANGMVIFKVLVIIVIILIGLFYIQPENWSPFAPNGFGGVIKGVSAVFFAYIGFDAISTTAEECKDPQKDLPKGMIYALIIATVLYVLVALVLTGMVHYTKLNNEAFLANAFTEIGLNWMGGLIAFSALIATASVLLVFQIGQPRIWMSMSRDGLLPKKFATIHKRFKTPSYATIITGLIVGIPSLFLDINLVTDLCSIGTLFAFVLVCGGVLILNKNDADNQYQPSDDLKPKFKVKYINGRYFIILVWILITLFLVKYEPNFINSAFSFEGGFSTWHHQIPFWIFLLVSVIITIYTIKNKWSLIPVLGFLSCAYLLSTLGVANWLRFIVWMLVGLLIYFVYSYRKSKLNK
ncbi:MAG: amino acid permease [Chitinophagales bacterium]|nr:amino acid permease [Chitinophagales bacterium]